MTDFAAARRMMVDGQVRPSDITDPRIIAAMFELPRERFVSERRAGIAYLDLDVPVGDSEDSRRLLKPMVLAKLIQAAEISASDRVLDVGCASGYSSALLSQLAGSRGRARRGVRPGAPGGSGDRRVRGMANVQVVAGTARHRRRVGRSL